MRTRTLAFGLYADERDAARVAGLVEAQARARGARVVAVTVSDVLPSGEMTAGEAYDFLAEQWADEHPGQDPGARRAVDLRVAVVCSLRTWRAIRKAALRALCPEGNAPHVCRVPWFAG
ncbi:MULTISPECIES: hypothetical protein [Streptomyces]|jgi:hypothetical protein|uniref:Uncharacterized protein n=2 Tax=Streptomyces TaxID=1883 RepID=A0A1D8G8V5_9ACTN|nr:MULTISPECIES: hypothetical protein [Streptomyces]AOT61884.1 hypothetical protein A4G23_04775 [Streptomyces rubrolavendulae]KAF0649942.1 hypothetical protein K701_11145 [Streptomyces fradiae ATCC 10745 = DSM 40063]OSY52865.1 hypothetical protein BG846_01475 [Streptomyces fradiae ATCC 10745 = DSM 40063]QEV14781.1 hypothetical protein CP974_25565 [Streptomyces fradiae ATCC 10745 = DSM 40063]UQS29610.1 hypothetical protein J5J01_22220 [Streptomyces fradiae]